MEIRFLTRIFINFIWEKAPEYLGHFRTLEHEPKDADLDNEKAWVDFAGNLIIDYNDGPEELDQHFFVQSGLADMDNYVANYYKTHKA